ncbi:60S ribosomal protein L18-2-like [Iris pallida]|uniref:60S ribosomal protein L18-2-like n=1 Tax=Iris pallida TaxID=29817 RepID=A0AAX6HPA6_IRIPA|nr:60S ribosomal protein L18-2-like [Iris pallida]
MRVLSSEQICRGLVGGDEGRRFRKGLVKEVKSYTKNARSATFEEILVFRKGLVKEAKSYTKNACSATFEEILVDALAAEDDLELRLKRGRDFQGGSSSGGPHTTSSRGSSHSSFSSRGISKCSISSRGCSSRHRGSRPPPVLIARSQGTGGASVGRDWASA